MNLKSFAEMDASHKLAYKMGRDDAARQVANPDLINMGIVAYQMKDYNPFTKDEWQELFDAALGEYT